MMHNPLGFGNGHSDDPYGPPPITVSNSNGAPPLPSSSYFGGGIPLPISPTTPAAPSQFEDVPHHTASDDDSSNDESFQRALQAAGRGGNIGKKRSTTLFGGGSFVGRGAALGNSKEHQLGAGGGNGGVQQQQSGPMIGMGGGPPDFNPSTANGNPAAQAAPANPNDPKSLDRDTKRMLMGLMFPCVEVVSGILLDRFIEFDVDTVVLRSLVDSTTAGGVLSVVVAKAAAQMSLVHYQDCNFYHVTVDGVSRTLCSPTMVHLDKLPDVAKMEHNSNTDAAEGAAAPRSFASGGSTASTASSSLYNEKDDIGAKLAAMDPQQAAQLNINKAARGAASDDKLTIVDGFKIPSAAAGPRRGEGIGTNGAITTIAQLLQHSPLHRHVVGPSTTLAELEARFAAMLSFALGAEYIPIPTLRSVVTLPLSTSRYISEMVAYRAATLKEQERQTHSRARHGVGAASGGARAPPAFYQSLVKKGIGAKGAFEDFASAGHGKSSNSKSSRRYGSSGTSASLYGDDDIYGGGGFSHSTTGHSEVPHQRSVTAADALLLGDDPSSSTATAGAHAANELLYASHVPPVQFAVDELCLQIRQHRPFNHIATEARHLEAMLDGYDVAKSYDNAAHLVPCVVNLLEVALEDAVDDQLGDVLGGLVASAVARVVGAGLDLVFYEVKDTLATTLVSLIRKMMGDSYEAATRSLVKAAEAQQKEKDGAVLSVAVPTWENAYGLSEVARNATETAIKHWLPPCFACAYSMSIEGLAGGGGKGAAGVATASGAAVGTAVPVVLPSMTHEELVYAEANKLPMYGTVNAQDKSYRDLLKAAPFHARHSHLSASLPAIIAASPGKYMEMLLTSGYRRRGGLYSCIAAVLSIFSDVDLLVAMQLNHFPEDCNDNVAVMGLMGAASTIAPSAATASANTDQHYQQLQRCDRNGYTGHSSAYTLALCHVVKSVRCELAFTFPQIPIACEEMSDLLTLLLFKFKAMGSAEQVVDALMDEAFVPKPAALARVIGMIGGRGGGGGDGDGDGGDDHHHGRNKSRLAHKLGLSTLFTGDPARLTVIAQRLWPAIINAVSVGSHILNDGTCWATPILTPFENLLFEGIQQDLLEIIIGACHMLWALPPAVSGPLLCRAMPDFTSVLRRSSSSWFDLIGITSTEAKSRLAQAATAVMITKSIPRRAPSTLPRRVQQLKQRGAEDDDGDVSVLRGGGSSDIPPPPAVFANTEHLLHSPIDWMVRATSIGGASSEHAILLELHMFYCASMFWLDPFWWTQSVGNSGQSSVAPAGGVGGPQVTVAAALAGADSSPSGAAGHQQSASPSAPSAGGGNIFAETWSYVNKAVCSVRDLMPSPSPALLLWESVCRVTGAYASLQQQKQRPNERVYLAVRCYEAIARQRQQAGLVVALNGGVRYFTASSSSLSNGQQGSNGSGSSAVAAKSVAALGSGMGGAGPTAAALAVANVRIAQLPDAVDGWEDYASFYHGTPSVSVSRRDKDAAMVEEVLPCLVYVLDWIGLEIISRRLQSAATAASMLAEQLSYIGAPLLITNALSQLSVSIMARSNGSCGAGDVVATMGRHFAASMFRRLDLPAAGYSTPFMGPEDLFGEAVGLSSSRRADGGDDHHQRQRNGGAGNTNATIVAMAPYRGGEGGTTSRHAYEFIADGGENSPLRGGGGVDVSSPINGFGEGPRVGGPPTATPLGSSRRLNASTGLNSSSYGADASSSHYLDPNNNNATHDRGSGAPQMQWPEVRQVSRFANNSRSGSGPMQFRRLQRLQDAPGGIQQPFSANSGGGQDARAAGERSRGDGAAPSPHSSSGHNPRRRASIPLNVSFGDGPASSVNNSGIVARKVDVLDMIARAYS